MSKKGRVHVARVHLNPFPRQRATSKIPIVNYVIVQASGRAREERKERYREIT